MKLYQETYRPHSTIKILHTLKIQMMTKHVLFFATSILLLFCSMSCGRSVLLATFNDDTVGSRPNTSLPGGPAGDRIHPPNLDAMVINHSGDKCLQLIRSTNSSFPQYYHFITPQLDNSKSYSFTLTGYSTDDFNDRSAHVFLGNLHYRPALDFKLQAGLIFFYNSNSGSYTEIGTYRRDETMVFLMRVDRSTRTYTYSIHVGSRPVLRGNGAVEDLLFTDLPTTEMAVSVYFNLPVGTTDPHPTDQFVVCEVTGAETRRE